MRLAVIAAAVTAALVSGAATAAVTEQNFLLNTTGDLVALCGVSKDDPEKIAAIHFCHGYAGYDSYLGIYCPDSDCFRRDLVWIFYPD